jgi:hypothetical protein
MGEAVEEFLSHSKACTGILQLLGHIRLDKLSVWEHCTYNRLGALPGACI